MSEQATEDQETSVRAFDLDVGRRVHAALIGLFNEEEQRIHTRDLLDGRPIRKVDAAHVCLVEALTAEAKLELWPFIHKGDPERNWPSLKDFKTGPGLYSGGYLLPLVRLMRATNDHVRIQSHADAPIVLWSDHFRAMLAPRIEDVGMSDVRSEGSREASTEAPLRKDEDVDEEGSS